VRYGEPRATYGAVSGQSRDSRGARGSPYRFLSLSRDPFVIV